MYIEAIPGLICKEGIMDWHKFFSGRFVFTVITALVFAYSVYKELLTNEQIYGIITLVLAFYFSKREESKEAQP